MISYSPGAVSGSPATDDLSLSARRERKQIDRRQSKQNYLARVLVVKYAHTCVCVCSVLLFVTHISHTHTENVKTQLG